MAYLLLEQRRNRECLSIATPRQKPEHVVDNVFDGDFVDLPECGDEERVDVDCREFLV